MSVLFADLVGFTTFAGRCHPQELAQVLATLFGAFDEVVRREGGERIKTIGDAYMVAVGCPGANPGHATAAARIALGIRAAAEAQFLEAALPLGIRIGVNSGILVGGVLSAKKPSFDVWGTTVNVAARLESAAAPGTILMSESAWEQTRDTFAFGEPLVRELKGVGPVRCLELKGPLRRAA